MQNEINDYKGYNEKMNKSVFSKLFFLDMLYNDFDSILDYGCANGNFLNIIHTLVPEVKCYGYDIDKNMIEVAKSEQSKEILFSNTIPELISSGMNFKSTVLVLSSIIHEIYSYSSEKEIKIFWDFVFNSGFKYVVIRDMMFHSSMERTSNINDVLKAKHFIPEHKILNFEKNFGSIENNKALIHLLLKYKYDENWAREVKENYLPLSYDEFFNMVPINKYYVLFKNSFTLPFIKQQLKDDMGIDIIDNTHIQILLKLL